MIDDLWADPTLPALHRLRRYMLSIGRYGPSPFLVGQYGGLGEIAQGFCRASAVGGTTYILGHEVISYETSEDEGEDESEGRGKISVQLGDFDERLKCDVIIASPGYLPSPPPPPPPAGSRTGYAIARCVAVIDKPIHFPSEQEQSETPSTSSPSSDEAGQGSEEAEAPSGAQVVDTALLVFPPDSLDAAPCKTAVHAFVTGEGSLSTPKDRCTLSLLSLCCNVLLIGWFFV